MFKLDSTAFLSYLNFQFIVNFINQRLSDKNDATLQMSSFPSSPFNYFLNIDMRYIFLKLISML
jgi:hypothetical protein